MQNDELICKVPSPAFSQAKCNRLQSASAPAFPDRRAKIKSKDVVAEVGNMKRSVLFFSITAGLENAPGAAAQSLSKNSVRDKRYINFFFFLVNLSRGSQTRARALG